MICEIDLSGYFIHLREKKIQTIVLFSVFVLQYLMEHIFAQNRKYNELRNEGFNVLTGIANSLLLFFPSAWLIVLLSLIEKNEWGLLQQFKLPFWLQLVITIFILDLVMYWWHRFNHTVGFLWRFHKFHHKDLMMNTTTAIRFHTVELFLSVVMKSIVFVHAGFSFLPILIYELFFFTAIVIHHSNIRITDQLDMLYRKLFSSPLMHRIHHSNKQKETDTNYGSVFSFWDRIFKTYLKKTETPIVFGVDEKYH